jgi:hypothetical protein
MKRILFTLFLAAMFVVALPLAAQTPEQEPVPENPETLEQNEPVEVDAEVDAEIDAEVDAQVSTDAESQEADALQDEERELPKTATPLALLALIGIGSAGTALGLRARRK